MWPRVKQMAEAQPGVMEPARVREGRMKDAPFGQACFVPRWAKVSQIYGHLWDGPAARLLAHRIPLQDKVYAVP